MARKRESDLSPIMVNLENAGIRLRRLGESELADVLFRSLNLTTDDFDHELSGLALNNELVMNDYTVENGYLRIGGKYVSVLTLSLLPEVTL